MTTKETVEKYFAAIHKGGWEAYIAEDFEFVNSNIDNIAHGKTVYIQGAGRFFSVTTSVEIKRMIIEGENVAVIARYELLSSKGNTGVSDVAEIFTVKNDQLHSSAIFFDTKDFTEFQARG